MKISLIGPVYPFRGGIAQHTALLATALQQAGHTVQIISFKRQYPAWLYPGKSDREPGPQINSVPAVYILDPLKPSSWYQAFRQISNSKPDLALVIWWTTFWSPAYASLVWMLKQAGVRVAFLIHNVLPHEQHFFDRLLARLSLAQGQGFILHMDSQRMKLLDLLPKAKPIFISPHPVYDQFLANKLPKSAARQRLSFSDDLPVILFFGIVRPYKGLKYLVEAIGILSREGFKAKLVVAGEFWEDISGYYQRLAQLGIADQVILVNRYISSEEVGLYFSAADIFVAPYIGGTQSGAVKIALAFGLPLILTESLIDPLVNGQSSRIQAVPPANAEAIANAIKSLLNSGCAAQPLNQIISSGVGWNELVRVVESIVSV